MYYKVDRYRRIGRIIAVLLDMDGNMLTLDKQTISKLEYMADVNYDGQKIHLTEE